MSRALNLSLTTAQVDKHCRDIGVAISVLEALPDGGARLVCMSNYGAAQIRTKLRNCISFKRKCGASDSGRESRCGRTEA